MNFQFESLADFWLMNGHGAFVWSAYAITFGVMGYLLCSVWLQRRAVLRKLRKAQRLAALHTTQESQLSANQ